MAKTPTCQACGGSMKKGSKSEGGFGGCLLFIIGIVLSCTLVGAIIGIPLIIYGMHLFGKKQGTWICKSCGSEINRKLSWYEFG